MRDRRGFRWGDLMEIDYLEDLGLDWKIILKWIFKKWDGKVWTGLLWLRMGTDDGLRVPYNAENYVTS